MSGFKKEDGDLESLMPSLEALMLADDPVEEPYKSKYKARDMLQAWRSGKGAQEEEEEEARVAYRIGKIALETEENHEADKELHASVQWFVPGLKEAVDKMGGAEVPDQPPAKVVSEAPPYQLNPRILELVNCGKFGFGEDCLDLLNNLGILHNSRGHNTRALLYLLVAKDVYRVLSPLMPHPPNANPTSQDQDSLQFNRKIDACLTHTLFYLAQVYGGLGEADLSGSYCHQTLKRQLEDQVHLDSFQWVKDCLGLVDYFINIKDDMHAAQHCLSACSCVLQQRPPQRADEESLAQIRAEISRRWGTLYATILALAFENKMLEGYEDQDKPPTASKPSESAAIRFDSLGLKDVALPSPDDVCTFEQAREVFLKANKYLEEARQFFVLDGFVTDHCQLTRDISRLYRFLSAFEPDEKRRLAMYLRRANALQPLVDKTNPKAFEVLHKQMSFELGEIYMDMLDRKLARIEEKIDAEPGYRPKKAEIEKFDEYCSKAIASFEHFTEMYQGVDDQDTSKKVWKLEKDDVRPLLRAFFHLARLRGKMGMFGTGEARVHAAKKSLESYEWLSSFAPKQLSHFNCEPQVFEEELKMVRDIISILPDKINRMHYQAKSFN